MNAGIAAMPVTAGVDARRACADHDGVGREVQIPREQKFFWFFFFKKRTACLLRIMRVAVVQRGDGIRARVLVTEAEADGGEQSEGRED